MLHSRLAYLQHHHDHQQHHHHHHLQHHHHLLVHQQPLPILIAMSFQVKCASVSSLQLAASCFIEFHFNVAFIV